MYFAWINLGKVKAPREDYGDFKYYYLKTVYFLKRFQSYTYSLSTIQQIRTCIEERCHINKTDSSANSKTFYTF